MNRLPYNQDLDHRFIKPIRLSRNLTLKAFEPYIGFDASTINKLEKGHIAFTPHYEEKLKDAIKKLRITNMELVSMRALIEQKEMRMRGNK